MSEVTLQNINITNNENRLHAEIKCMTTVAQMTTERKQKYTIPRDILHYIQSGMILFKDGL